MSILHRFLFLVDKNKAEDEEAPAEQILLASHPSPKSDVALRNRCLMLTGACSALMAISAQFGDESVAVDEIQLRNSTVVIRVLGPILFGFASRVGSAGALRGVLSRVIDTLRFYHGPLDALYARLCDDHEKMRAYFAGALADVIRYVREYQVNPLRDFVVAAHETPQRLTARHLIAASQLARAACALGGARHYGACVLRTRASIVSLFDAQLTERIRQRAARHRAENRVPQPTAARQDKPLPALDFVRVYVTDSEYRKLLNINSFCERSEETAAAPAADEAAAAAAAVASGGRFVGLWLQSYYYTTLAVMMTLDALNDAAHMRQTSISTSASLFALERHIEKQHAANEDDLEHEIEMLSGSSGNVSGGGDDGNGGNGDEKKKSETASDAGDAKHEKSKSGDGSRQMGDANEQEEQLDFVVPVSLVHCSVENVDASDDGAFKNNISGSGSGGGGGGSHSGSGGGGKHRGVSEIQNSLHRSSPFGKRRATSYFAIAFDSVSHALHITHALSAMPSSFLATAGLHHQLMALDPSISQLIVRTNQGSTFSRRYGNKELHFEHRKGFSWNQEIFLQNVQDLVRKLSAKHMYHALHALQRSN